MSYIWNLARADSEFSKWIRNRDKKCMNPLCICGLNYIGAPIAELQCSHYYDRNVWLVRFDPRNCIALGPACHRIWEEDKQGRYRTFMIRWLGTKAFKKLEKEVDDYQYKGIPHITRDGQIAACREFIQNYGKEKSKESGGYTYTPTEG